MSSTPSISPVSVISHVKDHDGWNSFKKKLDALVSPRTVYFYKREVWFCSIGHNIGHEEDGKVPEFARPVVIIKKCGPNLFIGIPLTTKLKNVRYYYPVGNVAGKPAAAMIAQMRLFSSKRLINKMDTLPEQPFKSLRTATKNFLFKYYIIEKDPVRGLFRSNIVLPPCGGRGRSLFDTLSGTSLAYTMTDKNQVSYMESGL